MKKAVENVLDKFNITSKSLIEKLTVVDENILAEAARQPLLFVDAARYRVHKMRRRAQADAALDYARSSLGLKTRKAPSEDRLTEGAVKAIIDTDKNICVLRAGLDEAEAQEELAKLILEAYRYRRDAIRILAEARVYEGMRETAEVEKIETRRKLSRKARELEDRRNRINGELH